MTANLTATPSQEPILNRKIELNTPVTSRFHLLINEALTLHIAIYEKSTHPDF